MSNTVIPLLGELKWRPNGRNLKRKYEIELPSVSSPMQITKCNEKWYLQQKLKKARMPLPQCAP